jgi:hypothetical protein
MFDLVYTSDIGTILPQEALLAAAVIISSYLATEDRTIEKEMIGNWFEAATWVPYSLRTKFKLERKHSLFIKSFSSSDS